MDDGQVTARAVVPPGHDHPGLLARRVDVPQDHLGPVRRFAHRVRQARALLVHPVPDHWDRVLLGPGHLAPGLRQEVRLDADHQRAGRVDLARAPQGSVGNPKQLPVQTLPWEQEPQPSEPGRRQRSVRFHGHWSVGPSEPPVLPA